MDRLIYFILVIVSSTFAVSGKLDCENGIDDFQTSKDLFWNSEEDIDEYLRTHEEFELRQHVPENITQFELEAFSGLVSKNTNKK